MYSKTYLTRLMFGLSDLEPDGAFNVCSFTQQNVMCMLHS